MLKNIFSAKGTVSRQYFLVCVILHVLAVPLAMALCVAVWLLSSPIESASGGHIWSESNAAWVKDHLGWIMRGWHPILPAIVIYLVAYRIFSCAYVKRARAIGVELTLGEVYYCFMGWERGANINDLLKRNCRDS